MLGPGNEVNFEYTASAQHVNSCRNEQSSFRIRKEHLSASAEIHDANFLEPFAIATEVAVFLAFWSVIAKE